MSAKKKNIRDKFRSDVFGRDGYQCRVCSRDHGLDAHHVTDRKEIPDGGYVKENGISLCDACHLKAELWHSSGHAKWHDG